MSPLTQQQPVPSPQMCAARAACAPPPRRMHRAAVPALLALVAMALVAFLALGGEGPRAAAGALLRRATSGSNGLLQNKLYLVIVIVGLFLVLLAAVSLSFWCCRGAFENPCCCPCYLCACCGGLVCLECITCGLCAEAV